MSLLLVHECGHILVAFLLKWNILKLKLYPFGALTLFQEHLNKPIREEFLIVLAGPIFQILFYQMCSSFNWTHFKDIHYCLLCFNLFPIVPLDGSKIIELFLERFYSYWNSNNFIFYISIIMFPFLIFYFGFSLVLLLILITLLMDSFEYFLERKNRFGKFLLERILYSFNFQRRMVIQNGNVKKMKRDTKHLFYLNNCYITEEHYLQKMFDFKGKT